MHSSCWPIRRPHMLYNMHLIVMIMLDCVLAPLVEFEDELYVCFGSRCGRGLSCWLYAVACLFMRVFCCVLVEDRGFEGIKTHRPRRQLPQPCGLQRAPAVSSPRSAGKILPRSAREAPTCSSRKDSPSCWQIRADISSGGKRSGRERMRGGGRRLPWINAVPPLHSLHRHTGV